MFCIVSVFTVWALFYFMEFAWPRSVFIGLWFSSIGVCAGVGTTIAWVNTDVVPRLRSFSALLWVAIGLGVAWLAYYYKVVIDPNPAAFTSQEITATAIMWAMLVPNVAAVAIGLYRQIRAGWI